VQSGGLHAQERVSTSETTRIGMLTFLFWKKKTKEKRGKERKKERKEWLLSIENTQK